MTVPTPPEEPSTDPQPLPGVGPTAGLPPDEAVRAAELEEAEDTGDEDKSL